VRIQKNKRFSDCCVAQYDRFGGGSELVWGAFLFKGPRSNGALTGIRFSSNRETIYRGHKCRIRFNG
jgi:hypothetical protein